MLSVEHLSMTFESSSGARVPALEDVGFEVREHEFIVIVGPSGCGKTTLLKLIAGLVIPTHGTIIFRGRQRLGPDRDVGLVFQHAVLLRWRTIVENVLLPIEILGLPVRLHRQRAMDLLALVGLQGFEHKMPRELSGGMQQRASIARALIHDPSLLLMDEPFGALDALTRETMAVELLRIWEEQKKAVILVTHSIPEAILLADRVIAFSARPGRAVRVVEVNLPRPRLPEMEFQEEYAGDYRDAARALREVIYGVVA